MDILNQFAFPPEAKADFIEKGLVSTSLGAGVSDIQLNGFDKGVAYRFFVAAVPNKVKSEDAGIEINDEIEMIEWVKDRKNKPTERVTMLPEKLLKFRRKKNANGAMELVKDAKGNLELIGGLYAESYKRFKEGITSPGMQISRWEKASVGQAATLASEGIHTVQQFAAMPRDRVEGRFPKSIIELFELAIQYTNREQALSNVKDSVEHVLALKQEQSKLADENRILKEQLEAARSKKTKANKTEITQASV